MDDAKAYGLATLRLEALKLTVSSLKDPQDFSPEELISVAAQFADFIINGTTTKEQPK